MPTGDAVVFDIGEKMESEINREVFSSGAVVIGSQYDNLTKLFDGNLSTGINNIWPGHQTVWYTIQFPISIYIRNITAKPQFGGSSSSYTVGARIAGSDVMSEPLCTNERTFIFNCPVDALEFTIKENGTNKFNFNDFIINYIPLTNATGFLQEINELRNTINSFQNQIDNLNTEINNLKNSFNQLNSTLNNFNKTINNINQTQQQIIDEISNLWVFYNKLNGTIKDLKQDIININSTIYQNITQIESNLIIIENDIINIKKNINNVTLNSNNITVLQDLINVAQEDITNLKTNLTGLSESIPDAYDDTNLQNKILTLESENAKLKNDMLNQTTEIDNLNTEINILNTDLNNLKLDLNELKEHDDDEDEDKDGAEDISTLAYGGIGLGILGVILALVAIAMLLKKKSPPMMPPETQEEPIQSVTPEQPTGKEVGGVVQQEQLQITPEFQDQESIQIQQQDGIS
jgi:uncharacterized coiled-coil DUF342 family protein